MAIARRLKQALATILLMTLLEFLSVETMVSVLDVNLLCCRVAFVLSFKLSNVIFHLSFICGESGIRRFWTGIFAAW